MDDDFVIFDDEHHGCVLVGPFPTYEVAEEYAEKHEGEVVSPIEP